MDTPQTPLPANETDEQRDIRLHKDIAAFGYIWIMSIAVYASHRDSKFVQFHSKQGIVLFIASIPVALIPFVGKYLLLLLVAAMLLGFINAAQGQYRDVPIAGPLSRGDMKVMDLLTMIVDGIKKIIELVKKAMKSEKKEPTPAPTPPPAPPTQNPVANPPPSLPPGDQPKNN